MTLPNQSDPVLEVLNSQEFWRLRQELQSAGDIFELDVGTRAIYVGPDSDVSEIKLIYFNQQSPNNLATAIVSPAGPWVNRLDALMATKEAITNLPGRILITPADFVDPNYVRPVTDPDFAPFRNYVIKPQIDLICGFNEVDVADVRADRTHRLPSVPFERDTVGGAGRSTDIVIPAYGRRLITVFLVVPAGTGNFTVTFMEVILQPGASSSPGYGLPRLLATEAIAGGSVAQTFPYVFRASSDVRALVDTTSVTDQQLDPVPGPIGMMDYFLINIQKDAAEAPAGVLSCQLYVRMSDREG